MYTFNFTYIFMNLFTIYLLLLTFLAPFGVLRLYFFLHWSRSFYRRRNSPFSAILYNMHLFVVLWMILYLFFCICTQQAQGLLANGAIVCTYLASSTHCHHVTSVCLLRSLIVIKSTLNNAVIFLQTEFCYIPNTRVKCDDAYLLDDC